VDVLVVNQFSSGPVVLFTEEMGNYVIFVLCLVVVYTQVRLLQVEIYIELYIHKVPPWDFMNALYYPSICD
jgi:hypothetical protein